VEPLDVAICYLGTGVFWLVVDLYCERVAVSKMVHNEMFGALLLVCLVEVFLWPLTLTTQMIARAFQKPTRRLRHPMIMLTPFADKAFFGPLFSALPVFSSGAVAPLAKGDPAVEAWARKIVVDQLAVLGFKNPPLGMIQIAQAIGRHEGSYGKAKIPASWAGSNNWGAVLCCLAKDGVCPPNTFPAKDSAPGSGEYLGCFKKYPTPEAGCLDMLRIATKTPQEKAAFMKADIVAVASAMYDAHYYTGTSKNRDTAIAYYVAALTKHVDAIAGALGEKVATVVSVGPSPAGEGGNAGLLLLLPIALGLLSKVGHSVGDPIIVSRSDAWDKMNAVNDLMSKTSDEFGRAIGKKKISMDLFDSWRAFYKRWTNFYIATDTAGINNLSAQDTYSQAGKYDLERFGYVQLLEKAGGVSPGERPPETKPPEPKDPNGPGVFSDLKDAGMAIAAVALVVVVVNAVRKLS
jgi:hypothetical protein